MSHFDNGSQDDFPMDTKRNKFTKTASGAQSMARTAVYLGGEDNPYIRSGGSEVDDMGVSGSSFFGGTQ